MVQSEEMVEVRVKVPGLVRHPSHGFVYSYAVEEPALLDKEIAVPRLCRCGVAACLLTRDPLGARTGAQLPVSVQLACAQLPRAPSHRRCRSQAVQIALLHPESRSGQRIPRGTRAVSVALGSSWQTLNPNRPKIYELS